MRARKTTQSNQKLPYTTESSIKNQNYAATYNGKIPSSQFVEIINSSNSRHVDANAKLLSTYKVLPETSEQNLSKAKRFRDFHNLEIITDQTTLISMQISVQKCIQSPHREPNETPFLPHIAEDLDFDSGEFLKRWIERSRIAKEFNSLELPKPKAFKI